MCPTNLGCSIPQLNRTMRISCMQMVSLRPQPSCYFSPIPAHLLVAEKGSAEFEEFLNFLGEKIALQGWAEYNGGLDVKSTYSPHTFSIKGNSNFWFIIREFDGDTLFLCKIQRMRDHVSCGHLSALFPSRHPTSRTKKTSGK